jgi:hypothetical protein
VLYKASKDIVVKPYSPQHPPKSPTSLYSSPSPKNLAGALQTAIDGGHPELHEGVQEKRLLLKMI